MLSPCRTAFLFNLHTPHPSPICIAWSTPNPRRTRALSDHNGTTRTRPRLQPAHNPVSRPFISWFSTSARHHREKNFYEILDLPVTASAADIKKKFYSLSLRHHPDRNRTDPEASERFSRISAAYNVLGHASKRASYDREHGFHHAHTSQHHHPMGSHSSYSASPHAKSTFAGSRPPSGLSKRRGAFRGPPPSFYAQGGYGRTGRTAEGSHTAGAGDANQASSGGGFASSSAGAEKGKNGYYDPEDHRGFIERNPLGHFDARGHFRTQSAEDKRRMERRSKARRSAVKEEEISRREGISVVHFFVVVGMLAFASLTASLFAPSSTVVKPVAETVGETGLKRSRDSDKMDRRRKEGASAGVHGT